MNIHPKNHWIWITYLVFYTFYMTQITQEFFVADSAMRHYYIFLVLFDRYYLIPLFMNALMIIMNILSVIPVYCYIFKRRFLSENFWKLFLVIRICAELNGHHYESKVVQAFWFDDPFVSFSIVLMGLCWMVPSYLVLYIYAFKRPQALGH